MKVFMASNYFLKNVHISLNQKLYIFRLIISIFNDTIFLSYHFIHELVKH